MNSDICWIPACGGTEKPFTVQGKVYLYMWNWQTREHAYYCQTDDMFVTDIPRKGE
jgi:hypothetical protein